jgi:hypothetical protein
LQYPSLATFIGQLTGERLKSSTKNEESEDIFSSLRSLRGFYFRRRVPMNFRLTIFSACLLSSSILLAVPPSIAQEIQLLSPLQANEQETEEAKRAREELEKRALALLEQLIADSASLTLAENRVYVQAKAVELLWKHDEARARTLAREVMSQIIAFNSELTPAGEQNNYLPSVQMQFIRSGHIGSMRNQLVSFLSSVDSKFALEFLRATRQPDPSDGRMDGRMRGRMGGDRGQEKYLEYQLAAQVAGNDPQLSFQMAEELIKNGLDYQLLSILNNLRNKDSQLGARLANEIVEKIKTADLLSGYENINFANQMLNYLKSQMAQAANAQKGSSDSPPPPTTMPGAQQAYRDVLNSYASAALKLTSKTMVSPQDAEKGRNLLRSIKGFLPDIETHLPARAGALRAKLKEFDDALYYSPQDKYYQEYNQKMQNKSSQELVTMASTAPQEVRDYIYQQAVHKAVEQGDKETARKIAREHMSNQVYANQIIANNERQSAERAANEGKYDEALGLLTQFGLEQDKASTLARWATSALARGDEKTARQLLDEARGVVGGKVQTRQQLDAQNSIAVAYLKIDPEVSFELVERAIERLNEVIAAQVEINTFNGGKEGEQFMGSGEISNAQAINLSYIGPELMRKDFDRTVSLLDRWQLKEAKIMVSLGVLQNLLGNQRGIQMNRRIYGGSAIYGRPQIMRRQ